MREYLEAFGPLRWMPILELGQRVSFDFGGQVNFGTIEHLYPPFNGVQGIRSYASVKADAGWICSQAADELTLSDVAPEGMLF